MFTKFKDLYRRMAARLKGERYRLGANPSSDWLIVLGGFLISTALIGSLSFSIYQTSTEEVGTTPDASSTTPELVSSSTISRITGYYENRRTEWNDVLSGTSTPIDPSK